LKAIPFGTGPVMGIALCLLLPSFFVVIGIGWSSRMSNNELSSVSRCSAFIVRRSVPRVKDLTGSALGMMDGKGYA
jgi:hypothetical protein